VASTPREATKAADALVGRRLTTETIETAAEVAAGPAKPLDNTDLTHPYARRSRACTSRAPSRASPPGSRARHGGHRMTSLGERIKALRLERDLQQRQLAEKAELTPSMVSQIESGRLTPSLNTLARSPPPSACRSPRSSTASRRAASR